MFLQRIQKDNQVEPRHWFSVNKVQHLLLKITQSDENKQIRAKGVANVFTFLLVCVYREWFTMDERMPKDDIHSLYCNERIWNAMGSVHGSRIHSNEIFTVRKFKYVSFNNNEIHGI